MKFNEKRITEDEKRLTKTGKLCNALEGNFFNKKKILKKVKTEVV